jgi:hypothetical protein
MRFGNADPEKLELFLSARGPPLSASLGGGGSSRAWASSANRSAFSRGLLTRCARFCFVFGHRLPTISRALFLFEAFFCLLSGLF